MYFKQKILFPFTLFYKSARVAKAYGNQETHKHARKERWLENTVKKRTRDITVPLINFYVHDKK